MRRLLPLAVLAAAAACGPYNTWVPVEVDFTFGGKNCADAGVALIQVDIEGEVLTPNQFACTDASDPRPLTGVSLGQFHVGQYQLTVTGFDASNNVIFQSTHTMQVNGRGNNQIPVDTQPTTGDASLAWTFAGKSCDAAGVTAVRVSVDDQVITDVQGHPDLPCKGATAEGSQIGPLSPGSHTFALAAQGSGANYALANLTVTVVAGKVTAVTADLPAATPTTASAEVRWNFQPGGKSCAEVGVDHVWIYFDPPAGSPPWGKSVADVACGGVGGAPVTELQIVDVPDGTHRFTIIGTKNNQLLYYTHSRTAYPFAAPFTTAVDVTAEALP